MYNLIEFAHSSEELYTTCLYCKIMNIVTMFILLIFVVIALCVENTCGRYNELVVKYNTDTDKCFEKMSETTTVLQGYIERVTVLENEIELHRKIESPAMCMGS